MYKGKIIRFFEHRGLLAGICLEQSDTRMRLLCADGGEFLLSSGRIVHASAEALDTGAPREELLAVLQQESLMQAELSRTVDPESLWKKINSPGASCATPALARAAFGPATASVHEAAVISALVADHVYFKLHDTVFLANTTEQVQAQQQKKIKKQAHQHLVSRCITWLQTACAGRGAPLQDTSECIELLKDFAALGRESPTWSVAREILHGAGIADQRGCFDALVRLGVLDPDENLLLRRHGISHTWPADVLEQVEAIGAGAVCAAVNDPGRQDLTQQYVFAIDESFTRDVDDAISFRFEDSQLELSIHITDVAAFVPAATPIDREAARRGASLYLPESKIPMLPPALSEHIASFRIGERSPAVSFVARVNRDGELVDYRIVRSLVRIAERLTYSEADEAIASGSDMQRVYEYTKAMRGRRIRAGGICFLLPELQVRIDRSREITTKLRDRETPGQVLVSECMILANYCASLYLEQQRQPGLFRRQADPAQRILTQEPSLFTMLQQRRYLSRVDLSTAPGPHSSLGLRAYTSITSPLRKYLDLVMQRQLTSLLQGGPAAYSHRELHDLCLALQPVLTKSGLVENERWRYWVIKALRNRIGSVLAALVLDRHHGYYELLLTDYMMPVHVREKDAGPLAPGSLTRVLLEEADPFAGSIRVSPASPH